MERIKGPDFPTGGILITKEKDPKTGLIMDNVKTAYATGHGRVLIRARAAIEERRAGFFQLVITELPYQVNKATLQEKIADLVREKRIDGISDMRDESDRQGMRLVIELKREASPRTVLNQLYKYTAMQTAFGFNMLALVVEKDEEGNALPPQPRVLTLKRMLQHFLDYRHEVLTRRTRFDLEKARARAHILEGLKIALDNLDAVIRTIRESASAEAAFQTLQERFSLSEIQARAILDMQLRRLAALERQQIIDEYTEILKTIAYLEDLLANPRKILLLVRDELLELRKKYGDARRTEVATIIGGELSEEELVANDEVLVTISGRGYVKRLRSDTYRVQRRGGVGIRGQVLREEDALRHMVVAHARDSILFFTNRGKVYQTEGVPDPGVRADRQGHPADQRDRPRSEGDGHGRAGRARLREQPVPGDGDPPGRDQEDVAPRLRVGATQRPEGDGHRAERRAVLGQALGAWPGRGAGERAGQGAALPARHSPHLAARQRWHARSEARGRR